MRVRVRKNRQLYAQNLQKGGSFPVFTGRRYAHGRGGFLVSPDFLPKLFIKGLGKLGRLATGKVARTLIKSVGRKAVKKVIPTATKMAADLISGKNPKKVLKTGLIETAKGVASTARDELINELSKKQKGRGLKTRRKLQLKGL